MKVSYSTIHKPHRCASGNKSRPVLQTVFVDPEGWLVAADGYMLSAVPCVITDAPEGFKGACIPASFLALVDHVAGGKAATVEMDIEGWLVKAVIAGKTLACTAYDTPEAFPAWRMSITAKPRAEGATAPILSFSPRLLAAVADAIGCGELGKELPHLTIVQTGGPHDPLLVLGVDRAFGLLMPVYANEAATREAVARILAMATPAPAAVPS